MKILAIPIFAVLVLGVMAGTVYGDTADSITCGQTITQSVTLQADLNCMNSGTDGILLGTNNITLDCAGHTIIGPLSSYGGMTGLNGITVVNASGVTVKNCHVTYFDDGFVVRSGSGNTLVYDKSDNNGNYGFELSSGSNDNLLYHDEASDNGGYGFVVESGSDQNQVGSSLSSGNMEAGFVSLTGSGGTVFENDTSYQNSQDGFIISASNGDMLDGNQAIENTYSGFAIFGSSGISLGNNTSDGNQMVGYLMLASQNDKIVNDEAENNSHAGFLADSNSIGNVMSNNISSENSGIGYEDYTKGSGTSSTGNKYDSNTCQDNRSGLSNPSGLCS